MSAPLVVVIITLVLAIAIVMLVLIPKVDRATRRRYAEPTRGGEESGAGSGTASG